MKKNLYSLFLVLMAMAAFTACSSDDNDYQWAQVPAGDQVYFSKDLPTQQALSKKASSFTIPVSRVKTDAATTVNISLTSEDNFLTAPSSVQFAAGQATADLVLSYDPEALVYDVFKEASLAITTEGVTTPYGAATYKFTAGALSPFATVGKGTLVEDYLWGYSCSVTIAQNQENKNVFRLYGASAPVENGGETSPYLELTICQPGETYRGVTVTQNDLVYFADYNSGYHHSSYDADVMWYHPSKFTNTNPEEMWLHNKVLAYQEDGTPGQIQLAPRYYMEGVGGWNPSQNDGVIVITFPGFQPKDYSATLAAQGVFTDLSGNVFAQAIVELGDDATNVKAVVIEADADPEAVADAIAAGELEAYDVTSGIINVPIPEGLSGKLQIVLVVLDEEGAVKTISASPFEYYGGAASPWQSIGIGLYTEDFVGSLFGVDPVTYEVEIEENNDTPGLYRMIYPYDGKFPYNEAGDWDASATYNVEVNAEDPEGVYILPQSIGIDWGHGAMAIASMGGYYLASGDPYDELKAEGYFGTLVDGVITLPVFERETSDGGTAIFQGVTIMGTSTYYGCSNGAFKLVLPEAVSSEARARAAKANTFARHLNAYKKVDMKQLKALKNRMARVVRDNMIAE